MHPLWVMFSTPQTYGAHMAEDVDTFALDRTRHYAGWLSYGARNVAQDAKTLLFWAAKIATRRPFETMAEEAFDKAEKDLVDALASVRKVKEHYKSLVAEAKTGASGG